MDREQELALVGRLRQDDHAAFEELHAAFNAGLFSFLARLSRSRDVAEDLLEETWLRVVAGARGLRPDSQLAPWLFTIARNLHVSYCRSRRLESARGDDLIGLWPSASSQPSPFEATAATEMERRVESALASLPATYREVLLLVAVEGLQPKQAAAICEVSPETLRQRLHRARALMGRRLDRIPNPGSARVREVLP